METIRFNENCMAWCKDNVKNRFFILMQINYLKEKLHYKKYLYLEEIYAVFGAVWDPDKVNVCYQEKNGPLNIECELGEDGYYIINIH